MSTQQAVEDWTKFVTLNPPNEVKFKIAEEGASAENKRANAVIQIINKSQSPILFKVKTTNIKNYMVRPNSEIIPSGHSVGVKILTQSNINADTKLLVNDRFLVQLTKLDQAPAGSPSADDFARMWEKVDKTKLV